MNPVISSLLVHLYQHTLQIGVRLSIGAPDLVFSPLFARSIDDLPHDLTEHYNVVNGYHRHCNVTHVNSTWDMGFLVF